MAMQNVQYFAEHSLSTDKGTYLLVLQSNVHRTIEIGKHGEMLIKHGYYLYVGSAFGPGGIRARVGRHLACDKPLKWHIDYLRRASDVHAVCVNYGSQRLEDDWVKVIADCGKFSSPMPGFGASDSKHSSHLFFSDEIPSEKKIREILNEDFLFFLEPTHSPI